MRWLFGQKKGGISGKLERRWSSLGMYADVKRLVDEGEAVDRETIEQQAGADWRATVILGLRTDSGLGKKGLYPGHAAMVIWDANPPDPQYFALEIFDDGTLNTSDGVGVTPDTLEKSDNANVWFFTKRINQDTAEKMFNRIEQLQNKTLKYSEFFGNRYNDSFSCHTIIDDILSYGGLSSKKARPWSWGTVYFYSLSFGISGWHSCVMYNTKNW